MVGVDEAPKEREDPIRDAGCEKGDGETRRTFDHHHHPLVGTFSSPCPSPAFSSLFCSALSAVVAFRPASEREREREGQRVEREGSSRRTS